MAEIIGNKWKGEHYREIVIRNKHEQRIKGKQIVN